MKLSDNEYLMAVQSVFSLIHSVFNTDATLALTDLERIIKVEHAKTFNLNVLEGSAIVKGGVPDRVIQTQKHEQAHFPKEILGFPVIVNGLPITNPSTGHLVGTLLYGISQERELNLIHMAEKLSNSAEHLSSSAQEMTASSEELIDNSLQIQLLTNEATLGADKMDAVIAYIMGVTNTTNMLGLNASIEAARAGEHGRGFSVVAEEIRKLSTQNKTSVNEISSNLGAIRSDINNISGCIDTFIINSRLQSQYAEILSRESELVSELSSNLLILAKELNK